MGVTGGERSMEHRLVGLGAVARAAVEPLRRLAERVLRAVRLRLDVLVAKLRGIGPGDPEWCHTCNRAELQHAGDYRVCGECGHIFRTPQDLLDEDNEVRKLMSRFTPEMYPPSLVASQIYACPKCSHDF